MKRKSFTTIFIGSVAGLFLWTNKVIIDIYKNLSINKKINKLSETIEKSPQNQRFIVLSPEGINGIQQFTNKGKATNTCMKIHCDGFKITDLAYNFNPKLEKIAWKINEADWHTEPLIDVLFPEYSFGLPISITKIFYKGDIYYPSTTFSQIFIFE